MKKKLLFAAVLFTAISFVSCDMLKDALTIPVEFDAPEISVDLKANSSPSGQAQKAPAAGPIILWEQVVDINIVKEIEDAGASMANIKSLTLTKVELALKDPQEDVDLQSFNDIKLYFKDIDNANLVASVEKITSTSVVFKVSRPDVLALLLAGNDIKFILTKDTPLNQSATFKLLTSYLAKVGMK